jgi:hypothetical protein
VLKREFFDPGGRLTDTKGNESGESVSKAKISGPVTAVILVVVLLVVILLGYRFMNPPQQLGPEAKAIWDSMNRARTNQR